MTPLATLTAALAMVLIVGVALPTADFLTAIRDADDAGRPRPAPSRPLVAAWLATLAVSAAALILPGA